MSAEDRSVPLRSSLTEPLVVIAACFITGILLGKAIVLPLAALYSAAAASLLAWIIWDRNVTLLLFVMSTGGLLYHLQAEAKVSAPLFAELKYNALRVSATGVVVSPPDGQEPDASKQRFRIRLEALEAGGRTHAVHRNRIIVSIRGNAGVAYGDRLRIGGLLREPREPRNPSAFNYAKFLRYEGIHAELSAEAGNVERLDKNKGSPLIAAGLRCREWISNQITRGLEPHSSEQAALIRAMTLGAREDTPEYLEDKFRFSGTLHIFAVSGLHVGIVAAVVWLLASTAVGVFQWPRQIAIITVIAAVFAYALITGLRPSACRAAVMAAIVFAGLLINREPRIFNSTGAAALVILLVDTSQIFRPGFQLSFCVLLAIAIMATPFSRRIAAPFLTDPFLPKSLISPRQRVTAIIGRKFGGLLGMSIAAWLGSSLLTWLYFGLVTPVSVIANLLLIPLAFLVLGTATLSILLAAVPHPLPTETVNHANAFWAGTAAGGAGLFSEIPGGHWNLPAPRHLLRNDCELEILDLPYGGAASVVSVRSGEDWLIDSGSESGFRSIVHPELRARGIGRLDGLLLTHGDIEHAGSGVTAVEKHRPRSVVTTPEDSTSPPWRAAIIAASESGALLKRPTRGDEIDLGKGNILRVLYPPAENTPGFVANDRCLVLQLRHHSGWRILFSADSGFATERWLLENSDPSELRSDILIKGHHDGDFSGLPGFISAIAPHAIIAGRTSKRADRRSSTRWQQQLRELNIELFDQRSTGSVNIIMEEDAITLRAFLGDQALTLKRAD